MGQPVVVHEQDVDSRLHIPVLKSVVHEHHIGWRGDIGLADVGDGSAALLIHCHMDFRILLLHLVWLVADIAHVGVFCGSHVPLGLSLVATADNRHLMLRTQQADEIFRHWGLPGSADGDVSHADDGDVKSRAFQYSAVEKEVTDIYSCSVQP